MSTNLISILPRAQPYAASPWHYRTTTTVPQVGGDFDLRGVTTTIVDWVLVELRASAPGAGARAAAPVKGGFAAGLLLADGRITGINEEATTTAAALSLGGVRMAAEIVSGSDVYVLIHHRNHLSVMSAAAASADCGADYCADFRSVASYAGCAQLRRAGGNFLMAAGDVNRSGAVSWGDDDFFLTLTENREARYDERVSRRATNYLVDADLNFSGRITSDDYRLIVDNNLLSSEECAP